MSRAYQGYSTTTEFNVFTTTGYLSLASKKVDVFNLKSFYSNVVYTLSKTPTDTINSVDCETQSSNTGADNVMIFDLLTDGSTNNPKYPNMYQVMKISRENREAVQDMQIGFDSTHDDTYNVVGNDDAHFERLRHQIVLDYGMNARYNKMDLTEAGAGTNSARIYKFTPPSAAVTWVGQCSNRGICDGGTGLCQCFPGYSGDDCSTMNALAQ